LTRGYRAIRFLGSAGRGVEEDGILLVVQSDPADGMRGALREFIFLPKF